MGKQSQNCKPTGKKTKQFGAYVKRSRCSKYQISRMNVAASTPIPSFRCKRCALRGTPALAKYKKAHHHLCPNKTENKKKGTTTTQSNTMRNYVDGCGMIFSTPKHAPPVNIIAGGVGYNTQRLNSLALDRDFVQQALVDQTPIQQEPVAQSPVGLVPLMHPATQNVPTRNPYDQPMNPINFFTSDPNPNSHIFGHQCFPQYPYQCGRYKEYCDQKEYRRCMGLGPVKGRPPHDSWCPKATGFQYWHHR